MQLSFGVLKICFTALLEGIGANLNLRVLQIQKRYKLGYLFEGCYIGAIMGSAKIAKFKCL